jgi:sarcosine oxidase
MIDEDGGVIRASAAIEELTAALRDSLLFDEVISVRAATSTAVEVRAGGVTAEHGRVVVCAGRGTAALARGAGLPLPVRQSAHVRLAYPVRGDAPARLACLQDGAAFSEAGAYGTPQASNRFYSVGLGETAVHEDGSLLDPSGLAAAAERTTAYVGRALPGVEPWPIGARHCWVTEVPWSPDGVAVWEAGAILFVAGNNLFKHAPALGRALARAAVGDGLIATLRPQSKLGAALRATGA